MSHTEGNDLVSEGRAVSADLTNPPNTPTPPLSQTIEEILVEYALKSKPLLESGQFFDKNGFPQQGTALIKEKTEAIRATLKQSIRDMMPEKKQHVKELNPFTVGQQTWNQGFNDAIDRFKAILDSVFGDTA